MATNSKIRHVILEHASKERKLTKWSLVLGAIAAFLFGLFSVIVAFISFILSGDFLSLITVSSVVIQFLIPMVIGVFSIVLSKILLNKALGLKEWERATPLILKSFLSYYGKNQIIVWLAVIFVILLVLYFLKMKA